MNGTRYVSLDVIQAGEPDWVVPSVLPIGLSLWSGPTGSYKTTAAIQLATVVSCGANLWECKTSLEGKTIYAAAEQSPRSLKSKTSPAVWGPPPMDNVIPHRILVPEDCWSWDLDNPRVMQEFLADLDGEGDVRLVVIDPYANFVSGDENEQRVAKAIAGPLHKWAHTNRAAVLILHHTRKLGEPRDLTWDDIRGASALLAAADGKALFNRANRLTGTVKIEWMFRDHATTDSIEWLPDNAPRPTINHMIEQVKRLLASGATVANVARVLGIDVGMALDLIKQSKENS